MILLDTPATNNKNDSSKQVKIGIKYLSWLSYASNIMDLFLNHRSFKLMLGPNIQGVRKVMLSETKK